jgi:predicted metal-dependent HD superfamily phosphohydrolase
MQVEEKWKQLTSFSNRNTFKEKFWNEIVSSYTQPHRAYHNLEHINALFGLLDENIQHIQNPVVVGFAIIYHDVVYDTQLRENEEQSAVKATAHLKQLLLKPAIIQSVSDFILASKEHAIPEGFEQASDLAYFLDFDMSILGPPWEVYDDYRQKIRQEYLQYRTHIYKEGRIQALQQMLEKPLFQTEAFKERYEAQARKNVQREIELL